MTPGRRLDLAILEASLWTFQLCEPVHSPFSALFTWNQVSAHRNHKILMGSPDLRSPAPGSIGAEKDFRSLFFHPSPIL